MKTREEIKRWLLKNCVDDLGNLNLTSLDFSDFDGDVDISLMKVKKNLYQSRHQVVGDLVQIRQEVSGDFLNHKLADNEEWEDCGFWVKRVKKLKEISVEELEKMGYKLKKEEE